MRWQFYRTPETAWEAVLADCRGASASIDCEQYIFLNDAVGGAFLDVFAEKASQGIRVRVLSDAAGSYSFFSSALPGKLGERGVEIQFYNPIKAWQVHNISSWFLRDHRKIAILDSTIGYTGGVGIDGRMRAWRDTHMRIEGPVVQEMSASFEDMWEGTRRGRKFIRAPQHPSEDPAFHFLPNSPHPRERHVYSSLLKAIRGARRYIYLTTPYFIPNVRLFGTLSKAAQRGVDVKLLIPERSDVRTVDIASGSYFTLALRAGIRIFRYQSAVLHAKTAVVDGTWGTVGSANLDNLSLLFNYEGNLVSADPLFIEALKNHFLHDLEHSRELSFHEWVRRPLTRKFFEVATWPIHGFL